VVEVRFVPRFACVAPFFALIAAACGSQSSSVGQGGECQVASDCVEGLVCVPQKDGTRVCSNDLSGVQKTPPTSGGNDAGSRPPNDGGGATDATTASDAPTSTPDAPSSGPDATGD